MRIDNTRSTNKSGATKKSSSTKKSDGTSFSSMLSDTSGASETDATQQAVPLSTINPLLMLQEVDEREAGRKQALKKGGKVLQYLDEIRHSLLLGRLPLDVVSDLHKTIDDWRERTDDPKLNDILNEIELRAAIELAKIEKGKEKSSKFAASQ